MCAARDWLDEDVWAKANPSLGVTVKLDYLRNEARRAENVPAYQNTFRRLHLDQWTQQETRIPVILAAPQGMGQGWRSGDVGMLQAMWDDLCERWTFDRERVLLTGFSAGGAMSFYMVYMEHWPVTAVAALANYLPPNLSVSEISEAREVPVFYAVGMRDINHEHMRKGLRKLRSAGCQVNIYRPPIGHRLDSKTARKALGWFFNVCANRAREAIERSLEDGDLCCRAKPLEDIIGQSRWHESRLVESARRVLNKIEAPGWERLAEAGKLIAAERKVDAVDLLRTIERDYGRSRLGRKARVKRRALEGQSDVRHKLAMRSDQRAQQRALALYLEARQQVQREQVKLAESRCRTILRIYRETSVAERARELLNQLEEESQP